MGFFADEKPFQCQHCDYRARFKVSVVSHELIHTGEKPYGCQYCPYKSRFKNAVAAHERTHTGEKPFGCKYCDYRSNDRTALQTHERTHTGEKPFACALCSFRTSSRYAGVFVDWILSPFLHSFSDTHTHTSHTRTHTYTHLRHTGLLLQIVVLRIRVEGLVTVAVIHGFPRCSLPSSTIIQHAKCHAAGKEFRCQQCDFTSASKSRVTEHEQTHVV